MSKMVSSGLSLAVSIFILCNVFTQVSSLTCYNCNSNTDPKCGITWGYDATNKPPESYLVECVGTTVSCQKLQNVGVMEGEGVTRKCWSSDSVEYYTPESECDGMHNSKVCYCKGKDDKEPCNGKQLLQPQIATVLLGLSLLIFKLFL